MDQSGGREVSVGCGPHRTVEKEGEEVEKKGEERGREVWEAKERDGSVGG